MNVRWLVGASTVAAVALLAGMTAYTQQAAPATTGRVPVTKAQADRWASDLSNWGRWGKDDQLGALNLVTPQKRQQAMALAKTGTVISLERPVVLSAEPEESKADGKPHGVSFYEIRFKTFPAGDPRGNDGFSSDIQTFHVHGGMTHLDALCHDSDSGHLYNGFLLKDTVNEEAGCTKLGLDNLKDGIVTRGILIDMTRLKGPSSRAGWIAGLRRRHRGLGTADRPQGFVRRRAVRVQHGARHRPGREPRRQRWIRPVCSSLVEGARRGGDERRPCDRGRPARGSPARSRGARRVSPRRRPAGSPLGNGREIESLGVHAGRRAASGARQHRGGRQPARDVLRSMIVSFEFWGWHFPDASRLNSTQDSQLGRQSLAGDEVDLHDPAGT